MATEHFADANGIYLGGFGDGATPPPGAIATPEPPHGRAVWNGSSWIWDAVAFERQAMKMSFAQLLTGLVGLGWITQSEGEAWLAGTLPATVLAVISQLPENARFAATAKATQPSVVFRMDPLVVALASERGKTEEELDGFFQTYSQA